MALINRKGQILLNPAELARLYSAEVKTGKDFRKDGSPVIAKNGKQKRLTKEEVAYRKGWLAHMNMTQKIYATKKAKKYGR